MLNATFEEKVEPEEIGLVLVLCGMRETSLSKFRIQRNGTQSGRVAAQVALVFQFKGPIYSLRSTVIVCQLTRETSAAMQQTLREPFDDVLWGSVKMGFVFVLYVFDMVLTGPYLTVLLFTSQFGQELVNS